MTYKEKLESLHKKLTKENKVITNYFEDLEKRGEKIHNGIALDWAMQREENQEKIDKINKINRNYDRR